MGDLHPVAFTIILRFLSTTFPPLKEILWQQLFGVHLNIQNTKEMAATFDSHHPEPQQVLMYYTSKDIRSASKFPPQVIELSAWAGGGKLHQPF